MSAGFRAISNIEHGEEYDTGEVDEHGQSIIGNRIKKFPYGSTVTGLDKETMKSLWEAGVLEQFEVPEPVIVEKVIERSPASSSGGSTTSSAAPKGTQAGDPPAPAAPAKA